MTAPPGRPRRRGRPALNADGSLSEAAWQTQVTNLATFYGWRLYHTHRSDRSPAGFPDLVLIRPPELIFAELKTDKGRLKPEQAAWLEDLELVRQAVTDLRQNAEAGYAGISPEYAAAVDVYLWRPADFDEVLERLSRGRHSIRPLYAP